MTGLCHVSKILEAYTPYKYIIPNQFIDHIDFVPLIFKKIGFPKLLGFFSPVHYFYTISFSRYYWSFFVPYPIIFFDGLSISLLEIRKKSLLQCCLQLGKLVRVFDNTCILPFFTKCSITFLILQLACCM